MFIVSEIGHKLKSRQTFLILFLYILLSLSLSCYKVTWLDVEHLDMITTSSVTDSLSLSAEYNSLVMTKKMWLSSFLSISLAISFSLPLSCHDEAPRSTTLSTTASHVTLSTISDTMITSADEAPHFATLRTNYRIGVTHGWGLITPSKTRDTWYLSAKMLPIRPTYTTLPCSCEGTKKDIAKPSSQKLVNCLMNILWKFELSTSSGCRDLSAQS